MNAERLLQLYDRVSDAPDAIPRLRRFILNLAVCGRLVEHSPDDEPASLLRERIINERDRLTKAGKIREPRNAVEIDRERLPFSIPARWSWVRLIDIASVNYGFAFASSRFNNEKRGMPLIRIRDISKADTEAYYDGDFDSAYVVSNGDYLVGMDGDFNLRCWQGKQALLNQRVMRISDWKCEVCPEFIKLPLQFVLDFLHSYTSQTTVKHLSAKQVNGIEIPLSPLAEQHRIAAKVDELMALCDSLEEEREKREATRDRLTTASLSRLTAPEVDETQFKAHADFAIKVLPELTTRPDQIKAMRQTILDLAVRGKLVEQDPNDEPATMSLKRIEAERHELVDKRVIRRERALPSIADKETPFELPHSWRWVRIGEVALFTQYGTSRKAQPMADGAPVLTMGNIQDGAIGFGGEKKIPKGSEELPALYLKHGDLLYNRTNSADLVGKTGIYLGDDDSRTFASYLIRICISRNNTLNRYVNLAMNAPFFRATQIVPLIKQQTGQANVNGTFLKNMLLPLPPLREQYRIVDAVDGLISLCDRLSENLVSGQDIQIRLFETLLIGVLEPMNMQAA